MVFSKTVMLQSDDRKITFHNVTDEVKLAVKESGITAGTVTGALVGEKLVFS